MTYPEGTLHAASREGLQAVQAPPVALIRMLCEDDQFIGEGSDTLDKIKSDFSDVLCSSLGEAAGCMKGEKMKIHLDETKKFRPCQITTARQVPIHMREMAAKLMEELEKNGAVRRYDDLLRVLLPVILC